MTESPPPLSFGATSVVSLLDAVRGALAGELCLDWDQVTTTITKNAEQLMATHKRLAVDPPGEQWLRTSSIVLAAYQVLAPLVAGPRLLAIFHEALAKPFRQQISTYLESRFGISQDAPEEAFSRIAENFKKRGEQRFGSAFRYATAVRDDDRNFVNIERCFFNDFFRANGALEVTSLFCALDKVWAEALGQPRYGVRFERPTTLANGDDACRFQFRRAPSA